MLVHNGCRASRQDLVPRARYDETHIPVKRYGPKRSHQSDFAWSGCVRGDGVIISSPGKVILFGEYAVLEGGPALVVAISRHAKCSVSENTQLIIDTNGFGTLKREKDGTIHGAALPFVRALLECHGQARGHFELNSAALSALDGVGDHAKLGLGGSAATTVALATAFKMLDSPSRQISSAERVSIFKRAQNVHRRVQGLGSGADIAASAFGGVFQYSWQEGLTKAAPDTANIKTDFGYSRILPLDVTWKHLHFVWTKQSAHTPTLVRSVFNFARSEPHKYAALIKHIDEASRQGIRAWNSEDPESLTSAINEGGKVLKALGRGVGVTLWTEAHERLSGLATTRGGALKPTGAGGGDLAWVHFTDQDALVDFKAAAQDEGFFTLTLDIDEEGVTQEAAADSGAQ